jgi:rhodanese-related sulfurtransferase
MKIINSFFFLIFIGAVLPLYAQNQSKTEIILKDSKFKKLIDRSIDFTVPVISVKELKENMDKYVILDAREKEEFEVSHIPGAKYIGYDHADLGALKGIDKSKELLFYCSIGYRSEKIGEKAKELGFSEVYNLYGSIFEWVNEGYELEDSESQPTKKVHGYNWVWGRWIQNEDYEKVY